jgi:autotransporter passenger strand-loop-strand repeat protein
MTNFSGGVVNRGTILATGQTAIGFDDDAVISGGVLNTGTIRAVQTGIVAITVSTFAGGITNNGTLSAGAVGIRFGTATNPQQYAVSSFTGDIVNNGAITAKTGITLIDSTIMGAIVVSGNLLATSHGILIDSASQLSNASRAGVRVTASKFLGGISNAGSISAITGIDVSRATTFTGGISNGGAITAVTGIAVGFNNGTPGKVSTFAGDIVNSGTISASAHGIQVGVSNISSVNLVSVFTGNVSNAGTISAGIRGIAVSRVARFGTSSADSYIVNTGVISAASGVTVNNVATFFGGIKNTGTIVPDASLSAVQVLGIFLFVLANETQLGDAAVDNAGSLLATGTAVFIDNVSTLFGGIRNSGLISSTSFRGAVLDNVFAFSGGIANLSGGIIRAAKTGLLVENGATFSGGISNAGTISAGSAGIELRNIPHFSGGVSNTGAISGATGIALIGVQSASVFDAGTIVGTGGTAIEFSGGGNTLTLGAGYIISGDVEASGNNAFRLGGTGSDTFDLNSIGTQYSGFTSFSVVGGHWNVSGIGGAWVVSSGAFELTSGTVVSNTIVQSGGTEIVDPGGGGLTTTVSKGGLEVAVAGGSGSVGILSGGTLEFVGSGANQTFSATLSAGATLEVGSGFTLSGSIPASITVMVLSGGIVSGGTLAAGDRAIVLSGGLISNSFVGSGGTAILSGGGIDLNEIILKSGNTTVSGAGFDSGATVSSGGKLVVASGGTEVDATVRAGGSAVVSSGGVAELISSGHHVRCDAPVRRRSGSGFRLHADQFHRQQGHHARCAFGRHGEQCDRQGRRR